MLLHLNKTEPASEILCHFGLRLHEKYTSGQDIRWTENGVKITPNAARACARSEGSLRLNSSDIRDYPEINLNYFSDSDGYDMRTVMAGMRFVRRMIDTPSSGRSRVPKLLLVPMFKLTTSWKLTSARPAERSITPLALAAWGCRMINRMSSDRT